MALPDRASGPVTAEARDDDLQHFGYRQELRRSLTFGDLLVYGLIFMVPIAPFGIFGSVFSASGGMVALAYIVGGVAMAFTALSYAQMSRAFPVAGSVYSCTPMPAGACTRPRAFSPGGSSCSTTSWCRRCCTSWLASRCIRS